MMEMTTRVLQLSTFLHSDEVSRTSVFRMTVSMIVVNILLFVNNNQQLFSYRAMLC
jgi:hypothetical protein